MVHLVELKDVELPVSMHRAMVRQAEVELEKRAKIIAAEGGGPQCGQARGGCGHHRRASGRPPAAQPPGPRRDRLGHNSTIVFPAQLMAGAQAVARFVAGEATMDANTARPAVDGGDRGLYDVVVVLGAGATGTLIAPVTYHRILAGHHVEPRMVKAVSRLVGLGAALLAPAIGCVLLLLLRVAGLGWAAWPVAALVLAWFALGWVALPLLLRHRHTTSPRVRGAGRS